MGILQPCFALVLAVFITAPSLAYDPECRKDPTWIGKKAECEVLANRNAPTYLWQGQLNRFEEEVLQGCVADAMGHHQLLEDEIDILEPEARDVYPNRENPLLVEVSNALNPNEAAGVLATAECMRKYHEETHFEVRQFKELAGGYNGGNNCTFMAAYLQTLMPGVTAQLVNVARLAWKEAQWDKQNLPDPGTMGIRTTEHLRYASGSVLGPHEDGDSIYTVLVALSDPEDYEEGNYYLIPDWDDQENKLFFKPKKLSALVFLSDAMHGVDPVTFGVRETYATEFWMEEDVPYGMDRPFLDKFRQYVADKKKPDEPHSSLASPVSKGFVSPATLTDDTPCRRDPAWIGNRDICALQTGWKPRSKLWRGKYQLDLPEYQKLQDCVAAGMYSTLEADSKEQEASQPRVLGMYPDGDYPQMVQVSMALNDFESAGVIAMAECMRKYYPETNFRVRDFKGTYGGNNCTYMSAYLQTFLPGVSAQLVNIARLAWREAQWDQRDLPDPGTLGLRTTEHLRYTAGSVLGEHFDSESVYTVLVFLSKPEDYEGGYFEIIPDEDARERRIQFKPDRLSALVFLSDSLHAVTPVTAGIRETYATEFWNEDDVPYGSDRLSVEAFHRWHGSDLEEVSDEEVS